MFSPTATYWLATAFVLGIPVAVLAKLVINARNSNYTPGQFFVLTYGFLTARILWRALPPDPLPVATNAGAVIVCNHRGPFDPMFVQLGADRMGRWLVAREYCEHPAMAWFFRICRSIPVGRGGIDTAATKIAIRHAAQGGLVGMFPEGRLNMTESLLLPGRPGAALVALKAHVPVIPCYIAGQPRAKSILGTLILPAHARVSIGQAIDLSKYFGRENEREVLNELTLRFLKEIATLAGQPDFEPRLAGRRWKPDGD
ncbi:MAG: 1-acyl-sn-glycerol-3-phosphate acyltransferase [Planctomycetales bacterium]|nr:1-acyl-sn-glycerol-3-phosphate acyltransferase [Planctomycetales bacterium]